MHAARQENLKKVGKWRCGTNGQQFKGDGPFIDPDYYIVDWDMVERSDMGIDMVEEANA